MCRAAHSMSPGDARSRWLPYLDAAMAGPVGARPRPRAASARDGTPRPADGKATRPALLPAIPTRTATTTTPSDNARVPQESSQRDPRTSPRCPRPSVSELTQVPRPNQALSAGQKRFLSIHEYQSVQLLNSASICHAQNAYPGCSRKWQMTVQHCHTEGHPGQDPR